MWLGGRRAVRDGRPVRLPIAVTRRTIVKCSAPARPPPALVDTFALPSFSPESAHERTDRSLAPHATPGRLRLRRGMADPRRPRGGIPAGRPLPLGRPRLHPHHGEDPGHRALPHQPVRADVRRDHGVEPDQDRHRRQCPAGDELSDQPGRLRHPQRRPFGAPRHPVRDAHAYVERRRRLGTEARRAADLAVLDRRAARPCLSRLRRHRLARRGKAAPRRRPRRQDVPDAAQPWPPDRRPDRRRRIRVHVLLRSNLRGAAACAGRRRSRRRRADRSESGDPARRHCGGSRCDARQRSRRADLAGAAAPARPHRSSYRH